ncbi:hypothetical protein Aduo_010309 [Ancylostoma duodenale]
MAQNHLQQSSLSPGAPQMCSNPTCPFSQRYLSVLRIHIGDYKENGSFIYPVFELTSVALLLIHMWSTLAC